MKVELQNASDLSHFRVPGLNYSVTYIDDPADLQRIPSPFFVIGNGTNLLMVHPQTTPIVSLRNLHTLEFLPSNKVRVSAGVLMPQLITESKSKELGGLEFTYPIPCSVGGALAQNFGAHGKEMSSLVRQILYYDPQKKKIGKIALENMSSYFGYRSSLFKEKGWVILEAVLALTARPPRQIEADLRAVTSLRQKNYPLHHTCGSIFKNPVDHYAGKLLDECGLRGYPFGTLCTSSSHANVIISNPQSTPEEILELIAFMKQTVFQQKHIDLEEELTVY
ncbi:MAG: UDP-N-acetylmuramate dehydrogenase [Candidatus Margulisiibacteriota bacterium]